MYDPPEGPFGPDFGVVDQAPALSDQNHGGPKCLKWAIFGSDLLGD